MAIRESDFIEALARLEAKRPRVRELIELKNQGKLEISLKNVAIEAGHSRTHLSQKNSKYRIARKAILESMGAVEREPSRRVSAFDALRALREENDGLQHQNRLLATKLVEAMGVVRRLEALHEMEVHQLQGALKIAQSARGTP